MADVSPMPGSTDKVLLSSWLHWMKIRRKKKKVVFFFILSTKVSNYQFLLYLLFLIKMKRLLLILVLFIMAVAAFPQKTLLIEKMGRSTRYFYHTGDYLKLRVSKQDTLLKGKLWSIRDSVISVEELRPFDVRLNEIGSVYKRFYFPKKMGKYLVFGSAGIFTIIVINHLLNNEPVFSPDSFIISGSMLGGGLICLSLSQKRCKIGYRWKIKVLDISVN